MSGALSTCAVHGRIQGPVDNEPQYRGWRKLWWIGTRREPRDVDLMVVELW
jgi:hypothetical protein